MLLVLIQTNRGIIFLRAWLKSLFWVSFVQFCLYSILNQWDKLFRDKMSTKYSFWKERKIFRCYKRNTVAIFQLSRNQREELIERIVWKVLNEFFFPVGKRWKSFRCLKSKLSIGIIEPIEILKLSLTGIVKIILKGEKFKVNYGIVIFWPMLIITIL